MLRHTNGKQQKVNDVIESNNSDDDSNNSNVRFSPSSKKTNEDTETLKKQSQQLYQTIENRSPSPSNSGKENSLLPTNEANHSNGNQDIIEVASLIDSLQPSVSSSIEDGSANPSAINKISHSKKKPFKCKNV